MRILKPSDTLTLLGYQSRRGQASLTMTVGYVCERDGTCISEHEAWAWLIPHFTTEPFDTGLKRPHGSFAVAGQAYAPNGNPVPGLTISVRVGALGKQLLVQGNRHWVRGPLGWRASEPEPFLTHSLGLECAYGASDWPDNTYGIGHLADPTRAEGNPLPNVELPNSPILSPADVKPVATFGPLPQCSPERTRWLGALDKAWLDTRFPWLPDGTDPRWYDPAPQDQCIDSYWRGDEAWSATHMHSDLMEQSGMLPGLRPRLLIRTDTNPSQRRELPLDLDTIWLFPNQSRIVLLYRAELEVRHEDASDVVGAAIFTERMTEPALPSEHYAQVWREQDEAAANKSAAPSTTAGQDKTAAPHPPAESGDTIAPLAPLSEISQLVAAEQNSMLDEIDAHWQALGVTGMREKLLANAATAEAQENAALATRPVPTGSIQNEVEAAFKAGEDEMRERLSALGVDTDKQLAHAHTASEQELDPLTAIASLPLADAKKEKLRVQFKAITDDIDAMEKAHAEASSDAERAASATKAGQVANGMSHTGPRQRLSRDELLSRHGAGLSASWTELEGLDLSGLDLSGIDLSGAIVRACALRGAILNRACLDETQIENCDLSTAQFVHAQLPRAQLDKCLLEGALLRDADLTQARLKDCRLEGALLTHARLSSANLQTCGLEHADLVNLQASDARFTECRLEGANATEATLDRAHFDRCTLSSACLAGASLANASLTGCEASATHFDRARLRGLRTMASTNLNQTYFNGADLSHACLRDTTLKESSLREAHLDNALLKDCDLSNSNAWHMVARFANFTGCRIAGASWRGANLMRARFARTTLENIDLSGCNLHAAVTRTASVQGVLLDQALLTRCRLIKDHVR